MEEEKGKNIGYQAAVLILIALLITCNIVHMVRYDEAIERYGAGISGLLMEIAMTEAIELIEIDHFADELDVNYVCIKSIEPIGFINYSSEYMEFRTIMYNVTFNIITEREANGSIEVWLRNYTLTAYMTFDVAVANNQEPMKEGNIYKFYYIYNAYKFLNVIYYEKIETGRID
jgi:hypothetical protein